MVVVEAIDLETCGYEIQVKYMIMVATLKVHGAIYNVRHSQKSYNRGNMPGH